MISAIIVIVFIVIVLRIVDRLGVFEREVYEAQKDIDDDII